MQWHLVSDKTDAAITRWLAQPATDLKSHTHAPSPRNWLTRPIRCDAGWYWVTLTVACLTALYGSIYFGL